MRFVELSPNLDRWHRIRKRQRPYNEKGGLLSKFENFSQFFKSMFKYEINFFIGIFLLFAELTYC